MKTIQLKQYGKGRYVDVSPFPLGELELEIQGIPPHIGDFRFLGYNNGSKCAESTVSAAENRIKISRGKLTAGVFSCFVSRYSKGVEVKRFPVEDLLIIELAGKLYADPETAEIERKLAEAEREIKSVKKCAAELALRLESEIKTREEFERRLSILEYNNDILK